MPTNIEGDRNVIAHQLHLHTIPQESAEDIARNLHQATRPSTQRLAVCASLAVAAGAIAWALINARIGGFVSTMLLMPVMWAAVKR